MAAGVAVVGFNPERGTWVTEAQAWGEPFECLPDLDGELFLDASKRQEVSTDQGKLYAQTPVAVLAPGSSADVRKMVRYCRLYGVKVTMRGQGHHMGGFALTPGLVIDSRTLNTVHSIDPVKMTADVDAGVTWKELLELTVPMGFRPPVLTGYAELSVGGVLAMGGTSGVNGEGTKVEHVRKLTVVTGRGQQHQCSDAHRKPLFEASLGGLGQVGLITRAEIDLVPCESNVRSYQLVYTDNAQYWADYRTLLQRGEVPYMFTLFFPNPEGGWLYVLNVGAFYNDGDPPDDAHLLRDLSFPYFAAQIDEYDFLSFALLVDSQVAFWRQTIDWDNLQKPWVVNLLPDDIAEDFVGNTMAQLTPQDMGPGGFIVIFSMRRDTMTRPLPRVPDAALGDFVHNFGILTSSATSVPDQNWVDAMLQRNLDIYDEAKGLGATRYPIGAVPFEPADWEEHFGDYFPVFQILKQLHDPQGILTPGPGIFE